MKAAVVAFTAAAILILIGSTVPAILLALGGLAVLALDIAGPPRCRCHCCSAVFPTLDMLILHEDTQKETHDDHL